MILFFPEKCNEHIPLFAQNNPVFSPAPPSVGTPLWPASLTSTVRSAKMKHKDTDPGVIAGVCTPGFAERSIEMNLHRWKKTAFCLYAVILLIPVVLINTFGASTLALSLSFGAAIVVLTIVVIGSLKFGRCPYCSYLFGKDFYLYGMNHCPNCGRRIG